MRTTTRRTTTRRTTTRRTTTRRTTTRRTTTRRTTTRRTTTRRTTTRRAVLGAGLASAAGGLLTACSGSGSSGPKKPVAYVAPDGKEVAAAEARR
ncbi:hypothetical protein, partial [Streptomyces huiliensis]|uniref:hypothetical protein n=1 Tax=Streptomyces huiliensis TaxID=2876027 RepID=UPI001CBF9EE8